MEISRILKKCDKGFSFEFFPPKNQNSKESLRNTVNILKKYKPLYTSMTYGAGGGTQERTTDAVNMFLEDKELVVMPHLTCIGAKRSSLKKLLDEYEGKGIRNIMALRGDIPPNSSNFDFRDSEFSYACDLVAFIRENYRDFCIGVAIYPEGHIEVATLKEDMDYTKKKIDAGADFAVTQMFFDNTYYYSLLERMKQWGITIPVIPGILPLTDLVKVKEFTSICRTTVPQSIERVMNNFIDNPREMEKVGVDFTIKQCQDLIKNGVKKIHFFTLNKPGVITTILDALPN